MAGRSATTRLLIACAVVAAAALAHRTALLLLHREDLAALVAANRDWYTYQQLPVAMLRDHLFQSLLYLQQTPPVSNLVVGVVSKVADWPLQLAYALVALSSLVSILTALVLVHLLSLVYPRRPVLWIVVGLLFVLNADPVVIEYNSLGQTIYEMLTMLLVLVVVDLLVVFRRSGDRRHAAAAGAATAVLALTRATWCLFALPGVALVALLAPRPRMRAVFAYVVPVLLLQGGWAVKNWAIYGVLTPAASSMGGIHFAAGMHSAGLGDELGQFIQERVTIENGYLDWQVALARGEPGAWEHVWTLGGPREREIEQRMGVENSPFNTISLRMFSQFGQHVFLDFAVRHPKLILVKWGRAYTVFWQPIASYGRMFVALFAGGGTVASGLDVPGVVRQLAAGTLPGRHELKSGTCAALPRVAPCRYTPSSMLTPRWLEPFLLLATVIGVHVLLPLVAVCWLVSRVRRHGRDDRVSGSLGLVALGVAATAYWYGAGIANLVETSENMRYRLEVEPLVWLMTVVSATELVRFARAALRSRRAAGMAVTDPAASAA